MTNVLLLCWRDTHHPQGGGSELYLEQVGTFLNQHGFQVYYQTAYYPGATRREYRNGINFLRRGGKYTVYIYTFISLLLAKFSLGILGKYKPDIVIDTQNGIPFFAKLIFPKTILLVHHTHTKQWKVAGKLIGKIGSFIETKLSPKVHKNTIYLTVSKPSATDLINLGVNPANIRIAYAGINSNRISNSIPKSPIPVLCTLGRLVPHKQFEDAIFAFAQLVTQFPAAEMHIIGTGWWENNLKNYACSLHIRSKIIFHGFISEIKKQQILATSWIHIMPSWKEGWGIAIIEAGAQHTPSIGYFHANGLKDSIKNRNTGILVSTKTELVNEVINLVKNNSYRNYLSENAYFFSQKFSWNTCGQKVLEIINELS